ncbi:MAG: DUF5916 domain-containing protein [Acidobacteria bacterium]|nr:DUF5916 domain-containing protein [Acidobacteriota bacterium]
MPHRAVVVAILLILSPFLLTRASAQQTVPQPAAQAPAAPQPAARAVPPIATFAITRATSEIKVDGVLDEDAWAKAAVIPLPYEWAPGDGIAPPVKTECLVTFDGTSLYIAFRSFDPEPGKIRAHLMDRDDTDTLILDDHIGVMIDTFNDERRAFQFRVNPLGVQADAVFSEQDGIEDFSWDMMWAAVGKITPDGYIIEMALPLKQLRFQPGAGVQTWGFEAFRSWPRNVRHRMTSAFRDRNKSCLLCQENKISGLAGLAQGRNLEFDPTATFGRTDAIADSSSTSLASGDVKAKAGVTARWSVTPNMTFNGTISPDFSQVEADVAQLDVNNRFQLFYPEKRPFFLEGLDFFTTPIQSVFTRTVSDPYFGAKLTGKQGSNAVGLFVTHDRLNNLVLPSNQGSDFDSIDEAVTTVVGRYRRDVGPGSTIGALYAGREGKDYHNRQVGLDGYWRISQADAVRAQYLRSDTAYPGDIVTRDRQPAGSIGGNAVWVDYQHMSRTWAAFGDYESYSPGFRSDTGYVPRVDFRNVFGQAQRRFQRGVGSWFNTIDIGARGWQSMDSGWTLTDQTLAAFVNYTGPYQTSLQFNMPRDIVVFQGVRYVYPRPNFYAGVKPSSGLNIQLTGRWGGGVDFSNGRKATQALQFGPQIDYNPVARVSLRLSYNLDQLSVEQGRLYRANLTQLRMLYHLNVRTFVRAILQYTDITRDPSLYATAVDGHSRRLFSQYLFSYKLNPQTVLFAGYSDNASASQSADLLRQDRTFFVKLGYAWVM